MPWPWGGTICLSIHNMDLLSAGVDENAKKDGFCYVVDSRTDGLPSFYQNAYHSYDYILKKLVEIFASG